MCKKKKVSRGAKLETTVESTALTLDGSSVAIYHSGANFPVTILYLSVTNFG